MEKSFTYKLPGAKPNAIPLSNLGQILKAIEDFVMGLWEAEGGEANPPTLSLIGIGEGSTCLELAASEPEETLPIVRRGFSALARGQHRGFPERASRAVHTLRQAAQRWGRAEVYVGQELVARIEETIGAAEPVTVRGQTVLYGTLQRIGGITPKAVIAPDSGGRGISCDISRELAKQIAPRIYTRICVTGVAEYDIADWSILSFKIEAPLDYEELPVTEALARLYKASPKAWEGIADVQAYISRLRSEEGDDC
ncbi:MAG: hypothetical protein ACM309_09810 [Bacillota bacterium]